MLYFHHFLHWRADAEVGKVTPVVALGESRARIVGAILLLLVAATIVVDVLLGVFPWYAVIAALTIIPVLKAVWEATGDLKTLPQIDGNQHERQSASRSGDSDRAADTGIHAFLEVLNNVIPNNISKFQISRTKTLQSAMDML